MVEQAIFLCVGFLAAALAALLAIPVIARRAMRLAETRARLRAPLSEAQAVAERDALRAQHAVEQVKLEQRLEWADEAAADLRAEVGRQSIRIMELGARGEAMDREAAEQRRHIDDLSVQGEELGGALGAVRIALHDVTAQRERAAASEAVALDRQGELEAQAGRDRAQIAILAARNENLAGRLDDAMRAAQAAANATEVERARLSAALVAATDELRRLELRSREMLARNERLASDFEETAAIFEHTRRRLAEVEAEFARSERAREETLMENGRQLSTIADRDAVIATLRTALAALEERFRVDAEASRERESALALRVQTLATSHATVEGSLRAARAEREAVQRESETLRARLAATPELARPPSDGGDVALREAIDRLGRDFIKYFNASRAKEAKGGHDEEGLSNLVSFSRRDGSAAAVADVAHGGPPPLIRVSQPAGSER